MTRLALALASLCASAACLKAPPFHGAGDAGDGDSNGSGDGDANPGGPPEPWAYVKSPGPTTYGDQFGSSLAISGNGATLAVGSPGEDSSTTTVNGTPDDTLLAAGAVHVFVASNGWLSQGYIKPENPGMYDSFGYSVALSEDGNTLAVGAPFEDGDAASGPGNYNENTPDSGAVYVFVRTGGNAWAFQAYLKAPNAGNADYFGWSIGLSNDGNSLVVGAPEEASAGTDLAANAADNSLPDAGAAYVFTRSGPTWSSVPTYIKASYSGPDRFGTAVAISGDAATVAIGAVKEDSNTTGINSSPNELSSDSGAVYVYHWTGSWGPQAYLKPAVSSSMGAFGTSVALSENGDVLVASAPLQASRTGAVFVFGRVNSAWASSTKVVASNAGQNDTFGASVAITRDGTSILVGAYGEASGATDVGGNQLDESMPNAGAAYLFDNGSTVSQTAYVKASNPDPGDLFGSVVTLADVASTFAVGAPSEDSDATAPTGDQTSNTASAAGAAYVFRAPQ